MGFDTLAPSYELMEQLVGGGALQRARLAWIDAVSAERVLLVGEGHGRCLVPLAISLPMARITCVDASAGMLRVARRKMERFNPGALGRIEWIHASVPDWKPHPGAFDLIVTNFFLDCFEGVHLKRIVECLAAGATPNGHWLISDFTMPPHPVIRQLAKVTLWLMYRFFRATTGLQARALESPFPLLAALGFQSVASRNELGGFVTSQLWQRGPCGTAYNG